jgi:uncharacterized membrane protein YfcA
MDNFNDMQQLWRTVDTSLLPETAGIIKTIRQYRRKHTIRIVAFIMAALAMLAAMIWVLFAYRSNLLSTRIGEACFLLAILILLANNANSLRRISARNNNNADFILFLKQEQLRLVHFLKRTQVIGFALASVGLLLYLFESVYREKALTMLTVYFLATAWLLFNWFVIRPRAMRKKMQKLKDTIQKLEELSSQLSDH